MFLFAALGSGGFEGSFPGLACCRQVALAHVRVAQQFQNVEYVGSSWVQRWW